MCYTKTEGRFNPCYVCHQNVVKSEGRANRMADGYLQGKYDFSDFAVENRWSNLFIDRTAAIASIPDESVHAWVAEDNFSDLAERLEQQGFKGHIPRLDGLQLGAEAFDGEGLAKDGSGWVAFNYKPFPGAFWPTNGATDDVMIRLPANFRTTSTGEDSRAIYQVNLALVEASLKNLERISVPPTDENTVGVDLDGDGKLGRIAEILRPKTYVGGASGVELDVWLYPEGTEFLHTLRYLQVDEKGAIRPSKRMKEVRYMYKRTAFPKSTIGAFYGDEHQEKIEGNRPYFPDLGDAGIRTTMGWQLQAFIEDAEGALRPQTYEETLFCMGCHQNLGSTLDQTFAFARKVTGVEGWGYIDLHGMQDVPNVGETEGEILQYLRRVGGGSEFRQNDEMAKRWFKADGSVDEDKVKASDVYALLAPSPERAVLLNKAYMVVVREQSYIYGRDPILAPLTNVFDRIDPEKMVPLPREQHATWDIRLAWNTVGLD